MAWDSVDGRRRKFKGKIRKQWGGLADEHLGTIIGKRNQLARKLQKINLDSKEELSIR